MKKIVSVLLVSLFATSGAFAAGHAGGAPVDAKKDAMATGEMKKDEAAAKEHKDHKKHTGKHHAKDEMKKEAPMK